jgi:beta-1,4-mannosyl-glycoprotein beta-1,4-N-acetylglucosaminyltransferase
MFARRKLTIGVIMNNVKVFDCFTYFNEDHLLKLRLEMLWDVVDIFIVCEATRSHTGIEKGKNFNPEKFKKYAEKIRYLLIDNYPSHTMSPWDYENYQRNYLINGLFDAKNSDWVIVSDLDEIPNPESIHKFNPDKYLRGSLQQYAHVYYLNNRVMRSGSPHFWHKPKITTYENLIDIFKSCNELRTYRSNGFWRGIRKNWIKLRTQIIKNGGWHFTWMGGVDRILLKMDSMAHQELNIPKYRNRQEIERKIRAGEFIFDQNEFHYEGKLMPLDSDDMPKYLARHPEEFSNLILSQR